MAWHRKDWWSVLLGLVLFCGAATGAFAQGYYYTVQPGDTLTTIARRHSISAADLARQNRLRPDARIASGTRLWVPAQRPRTQAPPARQPQPAPRPQTSSTNIRPVTPADMQGRSTPQPVPAPVRSASPARHVVQRGDTLWKIANDNGMSVSQLAALNGIDTATPLEVGQVLRLSGERLEDVPGGGVRQASGSSAVPAPRTGASSPQRASSHGFIWPVEGRVVRRFVNRPDEKFTGIDIAVPRDTEVRAARDGRVVFAGGTIPSYGRMVIIEHDGRLATCYGQLSRSLVREGQQVRQGQVIGRSGETNRGEAVLHFEIRRNGDAINPEPMLP